MPKLGLTMETGTIGAWLVEEGAPVAKGQPLLEIITDKVTMEVEAQVDGYLLKIIESPDSEVAVSQVIGLLGAEGEDVSSYYRGEPTEVPSTAASVPLPVTATPVMASVNGGASTAEPRKHRASPRARKMAAERGISLEGIQGSGSGGRIVSADVLAHSTSISPTPVESDRTPSPLAGQSEVGVLTAVERVVAERLTASYQQIPHIHVSMEVSAVWLGQFRQGYRLEGKNITYNDLVAVATARALVDFPRVNSTYDNGGFKIWPEVNLGIAVAAATGLVVPVVHRVEQKNIEEVAAESTRLVDAARHHKLRPEDMADGTFTISNLGMYGVSRFTAIINPPQVAILAVGAIEKRVVALEGDALAARPQLTLTLAADHRIIDGALAARFLQRLKEILETPGLLG